MSSSITGLPSSLTGSGIDADADLLPVYDQSAGTTKKITVTEVSKALTFLPSGTGAISRTVQAKLRDVISVKDFGAIGDNTTNDAAAIQAALNVAAVAAAGVTVFMPQGHYNIGTTQLTIPSKVTLRGEARESSFINYSGTATPFIIDSVTQWGLRDFRVSCGTSATLVGLDIKTTTANVQYGKVSNIELATGGLTAGQIGFRAVASGGQLLTDCWFEDINIASFDKPMVRTDTEGNTYRGILIDTWGVSNNVNAVNAQTHAEFFQARIAVAPGIVGTGCVAYKQTGHGNIDDVVVDCSASATALNVTGNSNIILLGRTGGTTPLGTYVANNTVIDRDHGTFKRLRANGTALVAGDFALEGTFGSTATVDTVTGKDGAFQFRVVSTGVGQGPDPYVALTWKDGAWTSTPFPVTARAAGNQGNVQFYVASCTTTTLLLRFAGTPVAGETYLCNVVTVG